MAFCLPPAAAAEFKKALLDQRITPEKMIAMTSEDRHALFEGIVGKANAGPVNALLESKLILKDQRAGLARWAIESAGVSKPAQKDLLTKIEKLDKVLSPQEQKAFLADLAATKLGTKVTFDESRKITALAQKAMQEREKSKGSPFGQTPAAFNAAADLEHYVKSLKPITAAASIGNSAKLIARNHLLMNPATPVKTTTGQLINSAMDMATRRIAAQSLGGENQEVASELNDAAWSFFRQTGANTLSMEDYGDTGRLGEKDRFDQAEGMTPAHPLLHKVEDAARKYAALTNRIAIDWEHNYTYTKFYQKAFLDMANIGSTNMAMSEGLSGAAVKSRAAAILRDAARIKPLTEMGTALRREAQAQGARVTSTNDTFMSKLALGVKDGLNKAVPGLGDAMMPIAKIPANIIYNGIENAGIGLPHGAWDIFQGRQKLQSADSKTKLEGAMQFRAGIQRMARTVGVLGIAALATSLFRKQDFRTDAYGNHFFRIGHTWINTEYLNFVSPAWAGMMYVKQFGRGSDHLYKTAEIYGRGATQALGSAPGVDELSNLVTRIRSGNPMKGLAAYLASRSVPAFLHSLETNRQPGDVLGDRPGNRLFFGAHGVETQQDVARDRLDKARAAAKTRAEDARYSAQ